MLPLSGTLQIMGTTTANVPVLNVGTVTLSFNVDMTAGSNKCTQLIVGTASPTSGTGRVNFGYNGGTTTVAINPQGNPTTMHKWPIIFFGSKTGDVTLSPPSGFTKNWQPPANPTYLEIDN